MKVWVDCTAAAHPLVLRPMIERLRSAGATRSSSPPASTGRRWGSSSGSAFPTPRSASHGGASTLGKGRALAGRSARLARLVWERRPQLALAPRLGRPRRGLLALPHPLGADAGLRVRRLAAPDRLPGGAQGADARLDPARAAGRIGAKERKLVRYPGLKEEYYLADFEPDAAVLDELGLDREKVLVVVRPPPETSEYHARNDLYGDDDPPPRRGAGGAGRGDPPHRAPGRGGARARRRQPDRPRAGDRRPEPDRLRRPRGQRGGDDEPRGGRPRHARSSPPSPAAWAASTRS